MRRNIARVIEAFQACQRAAGDSKRTCTTDGYNVWSYNMLIARRDERGAVYVVEESASPSRTTTAQIRALANYYPRAPRFAATRPNVPTGGAAMGR